MKRFVEDMLILALAKLNYTRFESIAFSDTLKINYKKVVPVDEKWHQLSVTVSVWLKRTSETKPPERTEDLKVFLDGVKRDQYYG